MDVETAPQTTSQTTPTTLPPLPYGLLVVSCLAMFAASSSGTTRAPFLLDMSRDLNTALPLVANLVAMTSIAWGVASLLAGAGSDRFGRRPFLLLGPLGLMLALVGVAQAGSFLTVALWSVAAGGFSGGFTGPVYAEVSARVHAGQRGRALGWVMAGQSLTLLVGVPMAAWIGSFVGWRGVNLCIGVLALAALIGMLITTYGRVSSARAVGSKPASLGTVMSGPVLRLLTMGVCERVCYGLTAVYFATFLQSTYAISVAAVAIPLALFAAGNILGTIVGGQLADRLSNRLRTFAVAMAGSSGVALLLFGWPANLETSVGLGFLYVFVNAVARPSMLAALTDVPEAIRGTVLGLNVTSASFGWLFAASLGGWMMASYGFGGFGPLAALFGLIGAALALLGGRRAPVSPR